MKAYRVLALGGGPGLDLYVTARPPASAITSLPGCPAGSTIGNTPFKASLAAT